jgi:hypothetical protein
MRPSLRLAALALVFSAGCGSDPSPLLDSGAPLDELVDDAGEQPDTPAPVDQFVPVDTPDAATDTASPQDVPGDVTSEIFDAARSDVTDATVTPDVSSLDAAMDVARADATVDAPRDVAPDVTPDTPRDVPIDRAMDVVVDVPTVMDVPRDIAPDRVVMDVPVDLPRDIPPDIAPDVARDVVIDTPVDVARDVPADNGCGTLTLCGAACVDTRSAVAHCGRCNNACPGTDTTCRTRTCSAGTCGVTLAMLGTRCTDTPTSFCDGMGNCVECLRGSDCMSGVCTSGRCQTPTCSDGVRNGTETGVDCGGVCPLCPALLALAGGTSNILAATYDIASGSWVTSPLTGRTVDDIALTITTTGQGVGLVRHTELGSAQDNQLQYTTWNGASWAALRALGPTVTTQGAPAIARAATGVRAIFHGFDFNHYFAAFDGVTWAPTAEPVATFGPRAGTITAFGPDSLFVYVRGPANELQSRTRAGTAWSDDRTIDTGANVDFNVTPTVIALDDTQALAVWSATSAQVRFAVRTRGGSWSTAANVPMSLSRQRVALASLGTSRALMAFHGTDDALYVSTYATGAWSPPARVVTRITGVPAVARGLPGAVAELAWIDPTGVAFHARLMGTTWSSPVRIGGVSLVGVALATAP